MFPDCMVDLETTGTDPAHAAIIQIAAVRFNYDTCEIGPSFEACLEIPAGRFWDESTREWWLSKWDTLEPILSRAREPAEVMTEFSHWCCDTTPALGHNRLWAKPIHFEYPFLQSYARQFGVEMPFHYRSAVDLNSFTRGMQHNPGAVPIDVQFKMTFEGEQHNAVDDVLHQIKQALSARYLIDG